MAKQDNEKLVKEFFLQHPKASLGTVARALNISKSTAAKYKPAELKAKPMSEEEMLERVARWERSKRALARLDWHSIKQIRNANDYRLYPVKWSQVETYFALRDEPIPCGIKTAEEFEALLKEVCDSLYDWHLYEPCPKCGKGIRVPRWRAGTAQWTPFCGCSEFPSCDYSVNREGESI